MTIASTMHAMRYLELAQDVRKCGTCSSAQPLANAPRRRYCTRGSFYVGVSGGCGKHTPKAQNAATGDFEAKPAGLVQIGPTDI